MGKISFNYLFLILLLIIGLNNCAQAQPQYYNYNTVVGGNNFPFNIAAGKVTQFIYLPGDFNQPSSAPSGNITSVYFLCSGTTTLYNQLTIKFALDTITNLPAGTFYTGNMDTVYHRDTITLVSVAGTFMQLQLDTPFPYDNTKTLIIEISQCGFTGTGKSLYHTSITGTLRRVYNQTAGGCNYVYQGQGAQQAHCGIDVSPAAPPTWTEQTSGLTTALYSVSAVDDNIAWTCGAQGKVLRTTDKGQTWVNVSGNIAVANPLYNIWGIDANNAVVIGDPSAGAYVWRTTNGGTNWVEVLSQTGGFLNAVWMSSPTNGFITGDPVGGRWSLWKTTNSGANWDSTGLYAPTTQAGWNNALYISGSKIWFGTNAAFIMYSSDNGATWSQQTTPATNSYIIWFNNENVGLSGGTSLYVTTDGGSTWGNLSSPVATSVSGITGSGTEWWVTPMATSVYYSANNGANWATQYTAPAGSFYHLTKARTGNTIWGVRSNGGISRYGSPLTGVTPIVTTNVPENYTLSQNYPNPFNPVTKINFSIPSNGLVTLKIYDVLGREITTLVNEVKNAGNYIVDFNASNLSSGVYFYKLEVNGFADVKKMTLVK